MFGGKRRADSGPLGELIAVLPKLVSAVQGRAEAANAVLGHAIRILSETLWADYQAQLSLRPPDVTEPEYRRAYARSRSDLVSRALFGRRSRFGLDSWADDPAGPANVPAAIDPSAEGERIVSLEGFLDRWKLEPGDNRPIRNLAGLCEPKRLAMATPDAAIAVELMGKAHPNFIEVTQRLSTTLRVQSMAAKPVRFAPLLLYGPPGIGKTRYLHRLAHAITRENEHFQSLILPMAGHSDTLSLSGNSRGWGNATPGRLVRFMAASRYANPIMIFDEIDKVGGTNDTRVADILLNLLEREQSRAFQDMYLELPVDLSQVSFVATANDLDRIPPPLLDRFLKIEVPPPDQDAMPVVAAEVWRELLAEEGLVGLAPSEPPAAILTMGSPREMQTMGRGLLYQMVSEGNT